MKYRGGACVAVLVMLLALATSALAAEKGYLWDGSQWKDMTADLKVAYVKGIGNMADFESRGAGVPGRPPVSPRALSTS